MTPATVPGPGVYSEDALELGSVASIRATLTGF